MMKKSPARSLSKGLSRAALGMRKSTAAARTMGKPSQRTPKETLQAVNNLNAYNQAAMKRPAQQSRGLAGSKAQALQKVSDDFRAQLQAQRPKVPSGLTGPKAQELKKAYADYQAQGRQTNQLSAAQRQAIQQAENNARQQTSQFIRSKGPGGMQRITKAPTQKPNLSPGLPLRSTKAPAFKSGGTPKKARGMK